MRGCFFLLALMFYTSNVQGQKRNNIWAFGDNVGLNFNTNPVSVFKSKSKGTIPPYYISSICAGNGNLLFYTDGQTVWNRDNFVLPKYQKWWPWHGNVMPLITPYVSNDSLYYIFGIDDDEADRTNSFKLQYLTIKMYNPGDIEEAVYPRPASVTSFYTTLLKNASHVLAGTGHCNQKDTWITVHSPGALYSFLITANGVNPVPVVTPVPASVLPVKRLNAKYSNIKFSANGERLIVPENDNNKIAVFDFNTQTGKFSNAMTIAVPEGQILEDIEISADAGKLYSGAYETLDDYAGTEVHHIYQMDLNAGSPQEIEKTLYPLAGDRVACVRTCFTIRRNMQLGPDGKIYISKREGSPLTLDRTFAVIDNPSRTGIDAQYFETKIDFGKMPRVLNYNYIRSQNFTARENSIQVRKNTCVDKPVEFSLIFSRLDSVKWDFGDASSGGKNFSTLFKPQHQYPGPGSYKVRAIIYTGCLLDTASAAITVQEDKAVHISAAINDTALCIGDQLVLNAAAPFSKEYLWENGLIYPERIIDKPGAYAVTIFNDCSVDRKSFKVTFTVCPCGIHMPNAFTPNYDGLNDVFKPVYDCHPKDYQVKIYDRYGALVFESTQPDKGWNGKNRNNEMPAGVYVWVMKYQHPGTKEIIRKNGIVTLLR